MTHFNALIKNSILWFTQHYKKVRRCFIATIGDQKIDRTSFYVTDEIVILFFFETNQQMLGGLKRFLNYVRKDRTND